MDEMDDKTPENTPNMPLSHEAPRSLGFVKKADVAKIVRELDPESVESADTPRAGVEESSVEGPAPSKKRRPRGGKGASVINSSPHRDEYRRLMLDDGWTSFALERYASYRYGEDIKASTFRGYKSKILAQKPDWVSPDVLTGKDKKPLAEGGREVQLDVMDMRQKLAFLQLQRISVDVATELSLGKLFNSTGREIELAAKLLDQIKEDQQDFGVLPKVADEVKVGVNQLPQDIPRQHSTLGEALGLSKDSSPEEKMAAARALGNLIPITRKEVG